MSIDFGLLVLGPCLEAFANPYQWQSQSLSDPVTVNGIFDDGFRGQDPLGDFPGATPVDITTSLPRLGVRLSDFPVPPAQGDEFVINGQTYSIREVQPDSHGGACLELNLVDINTT
ncbi:hypothetical protein SXCC_04798 [Gluconacetobacter sp. SXCC-1]|uniref:head-tail joining protein n=1 Tax=Komagataeibacter rhaeticus TaxID=215221 RepID=UPI000207FB1B|nr:hypothetical protein [Komagataeibacter rhaeticus]ATU72675.1 hypothetical protein CT154_07270 [Komagataeibacter xylinus]EGG74694.1 hypothetical protein SXCC_04798 [Gluconacetobacter sp. SXCC-1]WPP22439.1 hypothetical protein SCD25_02775 [Komagataeibacter rhaeticus]